MPDAWVIAIILTFIIFLLSFFVAPGAYSIGKAKTIIDGWGKGFWDLLAFAMQMAIIMLTGYVVATSPPFRRLLTWVAGVPRGPKSTIVVMTFTSMVLVLINWGLGLIGAAILTRYMAARQPRVDYRLLVAAAYLGMAGTWHAGLSASALLLVATPGNFAEKYFGVIPISQTIFSAFNLVLVGLVITLWVVVAPLLHPREADTVRAPEELRGDGSLGGAPAGPAGPAASAHSAAITTVVTPAQRMERSPLINYVIGISGLVYLVIYFTALDGNLLTGVTFNTVNFIFLFIGILLHRTPASLVGAAEEGGTFIWGIVLQFPFYAGMAGMIVASGLGKELADWFTSLATSHTYPAVVYWYSGIVNFFVPSGGSKFAIEAPYIAEAANNLGSPLNLTVLAYAWGDMATDAIQPFWALPLLGIAAPRLPRYHGILACALPALLDARYRRLPRCSLLLLRTARGHLVAWTTGGVVVGRRSTRRHGRARCPLVATHLSQASAAAVTELASWERSENGDSRMGVIDTAVSRIQKLIAGGELLPGQRLPAEAELAAMLGVSRNSLREAVRGLSQANILDVRQGDGTYVTSLEPQLLLGGLGFIVEVMQDHTLLEVFELRRLLEPAATGLACTRIDDETVAELRGSLESMRHVDTIEELVAQDVEFHRKIMHATGNVTLESLLDALSTRTLRKRLWRGIPSGDVQSWTLAQHAQIIEGLAARDSSLAHAAASVHVATSEQWFRQTLGLTQATPASGGPGGRTSEGRVLPIAGLPAGTRVPG